MMNIISLDEKNFEKEVRREQKPVIIKFHAPWCGPCKAITKIMSELAREYEEKIKFYEVDISKKSEFARIHNVISLPTILFMSKGKEIARLNGLTTKAEFKNIIQKIL